MPFQNLSGDPEREYFADGMVEEIITALSRIRWLFVVRHSSFTYKGQVVDVKQVGSELGVRYVASRHEPDPPSRRDPRRRCGRGSFSDDGRILFCRRQ